jgi:hypothetical protein
VQADGTFSTSVSIGALRVGTGLCRLRAVPAATSPTSGLGAFAGPRTSIGWLRLFYNGAVPFGFFVREMQLAAGDEYDDFGSCGIDNTYLLDPTVFGQSDAHTWFCNDWPDNPAISDPSRSGMLVDGHNAYVAGEATGINRGATVMHSRASTPPTAAVAWMSSTSSPARARSRTTPAATR